MMRPIETLKKMLSVPRQYSTGLFDFPRPKKCKNWLARNVWRLSSAHPLGIDIGHSAIKVVALDARRDPPCIAGYAIEPRPSLAQATSAKAIAQAVSRATEATGDVAIALPSSATLNRLITLPAGLNDAAITARMQFAMQQALRQPPNALYYDFQPLHDPAADTTEYALTACRRDDLEGPVALLKAAHLNCQIVDSQAHALARSVQIATPKPASNSVIGLIDIGQTTLHLSVLHQQRLIHSQDDALPEQPTAANLQVAVSRALALYQSNPDHPTIERLNVSGGGAEPLINQPERVIDELPLEPVNPLPKLGTHETIDPAAIQADLPRLLIALGLALHASDTHAHWR